VKDKLWFDISHEGETDNNIIKDFLLALTRTTCGGRPTSGGCA